MKSLVIRSVALAAFALVVAPHPAEAAPQPTARFKKVPTVIHNQNRNGQEGMIIRFDWEIDGCRGQQVGLAAFFEWSSDGKPVPGRPGQYNSPTGQLTTQSKFTPSYDYTDVTNSELFIPYDEISLRQPGVYRMTVHVEVHMMGGKFGTNRLLATSNDVLFTFTER